MKVLLVTSHLVIGAYDAPPLGLYRLKKFLEKKGHQCDVLDTSLENYKIKIENVKKGEYGIIGFSVTHNQMEDDLDLIYEFKEAAKKCSKKILFISGGQEATYNYEEWLKSGIDIICVGYAESSIFELAKHFDKGYDDGMQMLEKTDGVIWRDSDMKIHFNPAKVLTKQEFDKLTFDDYKELDIPYRVYWEKAKEETKGLNLSKSIFIPETVRLFTSSHCPNNCGYCSSKRFLSFSQQEKMPLYMLNAKQVYDMIIWNFKNGAKGFLFSDDEFFVNRPRIMELCDYIINAKNKGELDKGVLFNAQARVTDFLIYTKPKTINEKLIEQSVKAGFHSVGMGVETFTDRLLECKSINKFGYTQKDTFMVLDKMLEKGMIPHVFIILFIPEATDEEIIESMKISVHFLKKGCEIVVNPILRGLPGAPIFKDKDYPMEVSKVKSKVTGETINIEKEFIPKNLKLAECANKVVEKTDEEIKKFEQSCVWKYKKIPKTISGLLMFIATAKLLGRDDLANEWYDYINEIITDLEERIKDGRIKNY